MRHTVLSFLILIALLIPASIPAGAQNTVYPLPAPLYIVTSEHALLRMDPVTGEQTALSSSAQPVADFDIAPDGEWYVYRNLEGLVIISDLTLGNGFVLQFDAPAPPSSAAQTIQWSPDSSKVAYIVTGGVRIAELDGGGTDMILFTDIPGTWTGLYWQDFATLIAGDAQGSTSRITGIDGQWDAVAAPGVSPRNELAIPSTLTPDGVVMDSNTLIPATAGSLAFDWGPLPPPMVDSLDLPADLFFLMADDSGTPQLWQLRSGAAPFQWTSEPDGVLTYALSPVSDQIAYATPTRLVVAMPDGGSTVATPQIKNHGVTVDWSAEGSQLAYHDSVGVWTVPADGSQPARLVREHVQADPNSENILDIQIYTNPRWSPDGSRLLVTIGLWEGSQPGLIDTATGELTILTSLGASYAAWTHDGRIIGWTDAWGYQTPGLYLVDPAAPDAPVFDLLPPGTPVINVVQLASGEVFIAHAATGLQGPQFVRVQSAPALGEAFSPDSATSPGGYVSRPELFVSADNGTDSVVFMAGLRHLTYTDQGRATGDLVILDMSGDDVTPVQIQTSGPVSHIQWRR